MNSVGDRRFDVVCRKELAGILYHRRAIMTFKARLADEWIISRSMLTGSLNDVVESRLTWKLDIWSTYGYPPGYFETPQEDRDPEDVGLPEQKR